MTTDNMTEQLRQYSAMKLQRAEQREQEYLNTPIMFDKILNGADTLSAYYKKVKQYILSKRPHIH